MFFGRDKKIDLPYIISYILSWMYWSGCDPRHQNWVSKAVWFYTITLNVVWIVLMVLNIVLDFQEVSSSAKLFPYVFSVTQVTVKLGLFRWQNTKLSKLLETATDRFWPMNHLGSEIEKENEKPFRTLYLWTSGYLIISAINSTAIWLVDLVSGGRTHVLEIHVPMYNDYVKQTPFFETIYALQLSSTYLNVMTIVYSFPCLFITLAVGGVVQISMLKHCLRRMVAPRDDETKTQRRKRMRMEIRAYVEHHNLILKFLEDNNTVFSVILLLQVVCTIITNCFLAFLTGTRQLNCLLLALYYMTELLFSCIAGEIVQSESGSVSDAIYETQWYDEDSDLVKDLKMIMQRSQKYIKFNSMGVINYTLGTYTQVVRTTYSLFAVLRNVQNV